MVALSLRCIYCTYSTSIISNPTTSLGYFDRGINFPVGFISVTPDNLLHDSFPAVYYGYDEFREDDH